jgi:3-hydroxyacyl-CoA dehydrogenase
MAERCDTAAVLGAGVMGAGIAAHFAGAGIRTHLLDIVPPEAKDPKTRNSLAERGIQNALKVKPAAFYDPDAARLITPGNFEDHLDRLKECDLVVEAVVERMDIKKKLFAKLAAHVGPQTILASNTSGLSIAEIGADLPEDVQRRLLVMHFFNPVRYMRLLELVSGPKTDPAVVARVARIGEDLGKGIVYGKDTPNFVANRIGIHALGATFELMVQEGLKIEEVDKIVGAPMGRPKTGVFGLGDLVGIDTLVHVSDNCYELLPEDEERSVFETPDWVKKLVESGRTGRKAKAGFYKKVGKDLLVIDPESLEYREQVKVRFDSIGAVRKVEDTGKRIKQFVSAEDKAGQFAWKLTAGSLCYTARRIPEIADDIVNIDRAMRWGFNWELGPFEAWDAIGVPESLERMHKDGFDVPKWVDEMVAKGQTSFYDGPQSERRYFDLAAQKAVPIKQDPRHIRLAALHEDKKSIIKENLGASLVDLGDGCLCLEIHTKMNTIDDDVVKLLDEGVDEAEKNFEAMVIGNDGEHFGAGANIMMVLMAAKQKQWDQIEQVVAALQQAIQRMRYAKVPVVAAPFQFTFGGCAEIAMGADAMVAHAETYIGLVEVGVGVIPAGTGTTRMVERWTADVTKLENVDLLHLLAEGFMNIATARVATGAQEGKRYRYLAPSDSITLNRDHLLHNAKQWALGMARAGYRPPRPPVLRAAGYDAAQTMNAQAWGMVESGWATEYDGHIARKVTHILCGGNVAKNTLLDEQHYLDLEREAFVSLCGEEKTQARIEHMLTTGKPLRN